jgi:hypothetical protein
MTIKDRLEKHRAENQANEENKRKRLQQQKLQEEKKLVEALGVIREALEGFEFKPYNGQGGVGYEVQVRTDILPVRIVCQFRTQSIKYCDECPPENVRCLEIDVFWHRSLSDLTTSLDSFEKDFTDYLIRKGYS